MSGRVKIKIKDKKPKIDVFKVIENRFKNMNELRDLIDMDPRKGLVRIWNYAKNFDLDKFVPDT